MLLASPQGRGAHYHLMQILGIAFYAGYTISELSSPTVFSNISKLLTNQTQLSLTAPA